MTTPPQVSDEQIHAMCAYVRGEKCSQCSASVDTPYGAGQPGCHAIAEETLEKAREILAHPRAGLTGEQREALERAASQLDDHAEECLSFDCISECEQAKKDAATLRALARGEE
jgi:hypothetical protein